MLLALTINFMDRESFPVHISGGKYHLEDRRTTRSIAIGNTLFSEVNNAEPVLDAANPIPFSAQTFERSSWGGFSICADYFLRTGSHAL